MRYQDYIIDATKKSAEEVFRYAAAVQEDRLSWSPLDSGRTTIDLLRELAKTPVWAYSLITSEEVPADLEDQSATWNSVEECRIICDRELEKFFAMLAELPDEKLAETKWLPYEGGRDFTFAEIADYPHWNFTYHLGQIAYIQTLYGDKEMH